MNRRVLFKNTAGAVLSSSLPGADIVFSLASAVVPVVSDSSAVLLKMSRLLLENGFSFHDSGKVYLYGTAKYFSALDENEDILEFLGSSRGEYLEYLDAGRVARDLYNDVEKSLKSIDGYGNFMFLSGGFMDFIIEEHHDKLPKEILAKYRECNRLWSSQASYRDRLMISPEFCGRLFALRFLDRRKYWGYTAKLRRSGNPSQFVLSHPMHNTFTMFSNVTRFLRSRYVCLTSNGLPSTVPPDFENFKTLFTSFVNELGGADRFLFYVREDYSGIINFLKHSGVSRNVLSDLENLASVSYVEEIVPGFNDAVLLIKQDFSSCISLRCSGGDVQSLSGSGDLDWYFVDDSDPFLLSKERFFE